MKSYKIVLASASPRRIELLSSLEWLTAEVFPSGANEDAVSNLSPQEVVLTLAERKAKNVFKKTGGIVLGADTVVVLNGEILNKPTSPIEAREHFEKLCGKTHYVLTGVCVIKGEKIIKNYEKTYVTFGAFVEEIVYNYIASGKPYDKAGGYGIQDEEIKSLVLKVEGSMSNVIGLPIKLTEKMIKEIIK